MAMLADLPLLVGIGPESFMKQVPSVCSIEEEVPEY